jgi:hypothetical protein
LWSNRVYSFGLCVSCFTALAYLKVGNIAKNSKLGLLMKPLNILI